MPHNGRIAILTYHSIDDSGSALSTSPRLFAEQMQILYELGLRVIGLDEVSQALAASGPAESLVVITFDDGFQSISEHAHPVLQRYGFTATVFLVTDYCGKTNSWPSQPWHIERRPLLQWSEIKQMSAAGISFGSHTRTHPDLRMVSRRDAEEELLVSKRTIEDALGQPVYTLAYPYGGYDDVIRRLAAEQFTIACSTALGFARPGSDPLGLERLDMYYLRRPALLRHLFFPQVNAYIGLRRYLRNTRHRVQRWLNPVSHDRYAFLS
ncbi:MAG: polysaccharide deacetylase family protein [Acidobacteria bacterium]|nr:polysaccharide deacetylase family protein [Acidobacteriota bacterium]